MCLQYACRYLLVRIPAYGEGERETAGQTDRHIDRRAGRQTDGETERLAGSAYTPVNETKLNFAMLALAAISK